MYMILLITSTRWELLINQYYAIQNYFYINWSVNVIKLPC